MDIQGTIRTATAAIHMATIHPATTLTARLTINRSFIIAPFTDRITGGTVNAFTCATAIFGIKRLPDISDVVRSQVAPRRLARPRLKRVQIKGAARRRYRHR